MTDPTNTGRIIVNGLALSAKPGYKATPVFVPIDLTDNTQLWAYYANVDPNYPNYGYLAYAGGTIPDNDGWVGLYATNPLRVDGLWTNPECYWSLAAGPNNTFQLEANGGALGIGPDGTTATIIMPTPLPTFTWNTQTAPPPQQSTMLLGEFGGTPLDSNATPEVMESTYLGGKRGLDIFQVYGDRNAGNMGIGWAISQMPNLPLLYSITMVPDGGTLAAAANGDYDSEWDTNVSTLQQYGPSSTRGDTGPYKDLLLIRFGWEMNLSASSTGYGWSAADQGASAYIAAFQRLAAKIRAGLPSAKIIWCSSRGLQGIDPETCWPGDSNVDLAGIDVYENSQWDTNPDGNARFQAIADDTGRSLNWLVTFAQAHNKPIVIPEWGTNIDGSPYIQLLHDYMKTNSVYANLIWNSDSAFAGALVSHPQNATSFESCFSTWPN